MWKLGRSDLIRIFGFLRVVVGFKNIAVRCQCHFGVSEGEWGN